MVCRYHLKYVNKKVFLSLRPCLLHSPHHRPLNPRDKLLRQERDFNQGACRPRRWQASTSKQASYWGLDARFLYRSERKKPCGTEVKRLRREGATVGKSRERVFSLAKHLPRNVQPSKRCVKLIYSQVDKDKLSLQS